MTYYLEQATAYAVLLAPTLPFVRGRLPHSMVVIPPKLDWSFLRNSQFLMLFLGNFLQGLGLFIPALWLPSTSSTSQLLALQLTN